VLPERIEVWVGGSNAVADLDGCLVLDLDQMATRVEKCIQESADHI